MMWMTSLWPLVVMRPTLTPFFWMIALVPTVVPWASTASSLQSVSSRISSLPATMSRAAIKPLAEIGRRGGRLACGDAACFIHHHAVGEGAADVDAAEIGAHWILLGAFFEKRG